MIVAFVVLVIWTLYVPDRQPLEYYESEYGVPYWCTEWSDTLEDLKDVTPRPELMAMRVTGSDGCVHHAMSCAEMGDGTLVIVDFDTGEPNRLPPDDYVFRYVIRTVP